MYSLSLKSLMYVQFWNGVRNSLIKDVTPDDVYLHTLFFSGVRLSFGKQQLSIVFWDNL